MCNPILWQEIVTESAADPLLCLLLSTIKQGFPQKMCEVNKDLSEYWDVRKLLDVESDVVWYNGRIVMPTSLHPRALEILHSAHQGITGMEDRTGEILYWPGITNDIEHTRSTCRDFCKNAPLQVALPAARPEFQQRPLKLFLQIFSRKAGTIILLLVTVCLAG